MKPAVLLYAVTLALSLIACAPRSAYIPVSHNVPQFDSVRKTEVALYLSSNHLEVQAAANPFKHVAAAANINFGSGIAVYDLALGWYAYNRDARWHYSLFAGAGYNSNLYFQDVNSNALFNKQKNGFNVLSLYNKFYLQPSVGFTDDFGYYDIRYCFTLSVRGAYLYFKRLTYQEIDADKTIDPEHPVYVVNKSYRDASLWTIEPAITHTVQRGPFSIIAQLQAISPYSEVIDVSDTRFSPGLLFSLGFRYTMLKKKKVPVVYE